MSKEKVLIIDINYHKYQPYFLRKLLTKLFWKERTTCSGPDSVSRSLLHGLDMHNIKYNYNRHINQKYDNVIVLSGIENVRLAINNKLRSKYKRIFVGPNVVILPNQYNHILEDSNIDGILVPSQWVKKIYAKYSPSIRNRIFIFYSGIDNNLWKSTNKNKEIVLLYSKKAENTVIYKKVKKYLDYKQIAYRVLRYGEYSLNQYKELLDEAKYAIFFSQSESQGIALAEAWSMNVPTFPYDCKKWEYEGHTENASSCPYLSRDTGKSWQRFNEIKEIIDNFSKTNYYPSRWVNHNITDKISVANLLNIFEWFK